MVNVAGDQGAPAVEALISVNPPQASSQERQRLPWRTEQKVLEVVDVAQNSVVSLVGLYMTNPARPR